MIIVTYNINSIRIRIAELKQIAEKSNADIICLQEIKVEDSLFPFDEVKSLGFPYIYISGQKSYNGVAILSRFQLYDVQAYEIIDSSHKRHISAKLENGVEIHNFYAPAGGDIADPIINEKFDFKLRFYEALIDWSNEAKNSNRKMIMAGDMNIAPLENDVWSHKQLLKVVSHTPIEVELMEKLRATLGWIDSSRHFVPASEKLYSWWSYRNQDWKKSDRGRRLDHIWLTPNLASCLKSSYIMKEARDFANPSDHVPVVTEINI